MKRKQINLPNDPLFCMLMKAMNSIRKLQYSSFLRTSSDFKLNFKVISMLAILFFISACSKDPVGPINEEDSHEGKYLISFHIDGFSQDLLPFSDKINASNLMASADRKLNSSLLSNSIQATGVQNTDIRDFINTLEIKIYSKNALVDSVRQYADDPDFGKFAKHYGAKSRHDLFIVGAMLENDGDIIMRKELPSTSTNNVYLKILPIPTDAFFLHKFYELQNQPEPKHENLKLKRYVGRVEVNLDELIPEEAHRIDIIIENTADYFMPVSQRGYGLNPLAELDTIPYHTIKSIQIKPEDIGRTDYSLSAYFVLKNALGSVPEFTKVILAAYREDGTLIREKIIPNISLQANKRTLLTGKLFTVPNIDFEMELESDWSSDISEYEF